MGLRFRREKFYSQDSEVEEEIKALEDLFAEKIVDHEVEARPQT